MVRPVRVERSQSEVKKRVSSKQLHGENNLFVGTLVVFSNSIIIATIMSPNTQSFIITKNRMTFPNDLD